ncbi:hypothetical protein [Sphingomonas quercus]|uniref:Uncharacterized protein n=1 Tax=Sphingomonas quercus TaxID=2842451 RepID=A0ABS6BIR9_9SPHN|nr:hypothetical protein [Sphingomonas quercus]MBU3077080.1 hypothetical protein [Sphingomonas quercus]
MFKSELSRTMLSVASALVMSATLITAAVGPARAAERQAVARAISA